MGNSRGIPSPKECCHLNLASVMVAQEHWHTDWEAQRKMPWFSFPSAVAPANPQDSETPYCVSWKQAGQAVIGFGTKCKINI